MVVKLEYFVWHALLLDQFVWNSLARDTILLSVILKELLNMPVKIACKVEHNQNLYKRTIGTVLKLNQNLVV